MTTQKSTTAAIIIAVLIAIANMLGGLASANAGADWTRGYDPCATEDSVGPCYWDATEQGNGKGRSFVVEADGEVIYVDEVQPEHADLCTEDEILAYAPERPDAPICVHVEGDGARFFPSEVNVGK